MRPRLKRLMQVTMATTNHNAHDVFLRLHIVMRHRLKALAHAVFVPPLWSSWPCI